MNETAEANSRAGRAGGRPLWSGSITMGLVNVPVKLYAMVHDHSFSFRLLHRADGQPLRYERVCLKDGRVVPWEDTVKGYEVRKGEFVVFDKRELEAARPESDTRIRLEKFVDLTTVEPVYFETPYVLAPDRSEEAYSLLLEVLQNLGKAGVGRLTLRTKEYPVLLYPYRGALVLMTLRYADEVTDPRELEGLAELKKPKRAELDLAVKIVTDLSGDFDIAEFKDTFRIKVEQLIQSKAAGEAVVAEKPKSVEVKELLAALQETVNAIKRK